MRKAKAKIGQALIERAIFVGGIASVVLVFLILAFVFKEGLPLFKSYPPRDFFLGTEWQPSLGPPYGPRFGLLPNLWGSVLVTAGAALLAVPLGIATAVFIGHVAPFKLGQSLKAVIELLGAVPSVAIGFVGAVAINPLVKDVFHLDTGKSAMAGSILLAFLAIPTIATIAEDAMSTVPKDFGQASLALGATKWQTISRVLVPAAKPGIVAAVMLGLGRAIGETMVVIMVTGNAGNLPTEGVWNAFTHSVRTITGAIGGEALEVANGDQHYRALFMLGVVLLLITLLFNYVAGLAVGLGKRRLRA